MKNLIIKFSAATCVILFLFFALLSTSCKENKNCNGKITVIDTAGVAISGATVKLSSPPSVPPSATHPTGGDLIIDDVTDGAGVVNIELKLPAILDVVAKITAFPNMTGKAILRLDEPGKNTEITVTIKP